MAQKKTKVRVETKVAPSTKKAFKAFCNKRHTSMSKTLEDYIQKCVRRP